MLSTRTLKQHYRDQFFSSVHRSANGLPSVVRYLSVVRTCFGAAVKRLAHSLVEVVGLIELPACRQNAERFRVFGCAYVDILLISPHDMIRVTVLSLSVCGDVLCHTHKGSQTTDHRPSAREPRGRTVDWTHTVRDAQHYFAWSRSHLTPSSAERRHPRSRRRRCWRR
jgi:hypothetical protein